MSIHASSLAQYCRLLLLAFCVLVASCEGPRSSEGREPSSSAVASGGEATLLPSSALPAPQEPLAASLPTSTRSFSSAKSIGWSLFEDAAFSFYCGCPYSRPDPNLAGVADLEACDFSAQGSHAARATRIEWEHIVPASRMGQGRECWTRQDCVRPSSGSSLRGRSCCEATDPEFAMMHSDLHNLVPAVGQINAVRSDHGYGEVEGEERRWGACDFEDADGVAEPPSSRQGDVARVYLYMELVYGMELSDAERSRFTGWHAADPPDDAERQLNRRRSVVQGNPNPFIEG